MGLAKFLSKDFPPTAAALATGRNALDVTDSEGLEGEGVVGGVVVAIMSFACRGKFSFQKLILALE